MTASLAALEHSAIPVWLLDAERMRIAWANQGAVDLWRAASREDLLSRDLSGAPESVVARTSALLARVRATSRAPSSRTRAAPRACSRCSAR